MQPKLARHIAVLSALACLPLAAAAVQPVDVFADKPVIALCDAGTTVHVSADDLDGHLAGGATVGACLGSADAEPEIPAAAPVTLVSTP